MKNQQVTELLLILKKHPTGINIDTIEGLLTVPRRTLQRYLSELVKKELAIKEGKGRATRYYLNATVIDNVTTQEFNTVKQYINQPIQQRKPVAYQRAFLDKYIPNQSYYLPTDLRDYLKKMAMPDKQPAGTFTKKILQRLLVDLAWNSSRLEGNTYSLLETQQLINNGEAAAEKSPFETQMILNHKSAIEFIVNNITDLRFNKHTICNLHALLSENLLGNQDACGRLRNIPVGIHKTVYYPPEIPQLIEECFELILSKTNKINDPFEQSFFVMVHLPYLQPFEDVNKRVSRLAANIPLIRDNLCPISFVDISAKTYIDAVLSVYELNDTKLLQNVYRLAYERSTLRYTAIAHTLGNPEPFRLHYRKIIQQIIKKIVIEKLDKKLAIEFIHEHIKNDTPKTDQARLTEIIENELLDLHEGNIARFNLSLSEFHAWQKYWNS